MQDFRRLMVWRRAHELLLGVRASGGARFPPRNEGGSLKNQMISSAESIVFNIVEGVRSVWLKGIRSGSGLSIKSTCELEYQLQLSVEADLLSGSAGSPLAAEAIEIRRMLCVLRRRVLAPRLKLTEN